MQKTSRKRIAPKLKLLVISLSCFSYLFCFNSCYEPIEGCLDIDATNYFVSADRACDSCCILPAFNINVNANFNEGIFSSSDTLTNEVGNQFRISDFYMVLSSFGLTGSEGIISVIDSNEVNCNGVETLLANDLAVIDDNTSFVSIGTSRASGGITNIDFLLGLEDCYHDTGLTNIDDDNRINQLDTLFTTGEGFTTFFLEINDSLRFELQGKSQTLTLSKPLLASSELGNPLVLDLNIDFGVWLSDVEFDAAEEDILGKIQANVSDAITLSQ